VTLRSEGALKAGLGVIAATLAIVLFALSINTNFGLPFNISLGLPPGQDYTLKAAFKDANGLSKSATVVVAGNEVGQVLSVQTRGTEAIVTMRIKHEFAPIHKGTIARIRYATLLAQKYVELTPSARGENLENGATIASAQTVTPVDFDQFLNSLDPETRARLQTVIQSLGEGVDGQQATINDFLDQLNGLSKESQPPLDVFARHDPDLDRIVLNLSITSKRLSQSRTQLGDLVQTAADVNKTTADHSVQLATFFVHLANVMNDFDATLNGNEQNLRTTVVTLDPLITQVNGTLGIVYPYYEQDKAQLTADTVTLMPEASSAINCPSDRDYPGGDGQACDANGSYLRQFLVANSGCSSYEDPNKPASGQCRNSNGGTAAASQGPAAAPAQPGVPNPGSLLPNLPPCPVTPKLPTPPAAVKTPVLCPTPPKLPTPAPLPCLPTPTPIPKPGSTPTPTPSCIGVPGAPSLPSLPTPPSIPNPLAGFLGS
jgi:virulence factor Mce-like protein